MGIMVYIPYTSTTKSVTHGQCDARPTVTFPAIASPSFGRYQIISGVDRGSRGVTVLYHCFLDKITFLKAIQFYQCDRKKWNAIWLIRFYRYLTANFRTTSLQIILLGDKGTCMWTTCPGSLRETEKPGLKPAAYRLQVRHPNHYATTPHNRPVG